MSLFPLSPPLVPFCSRQFSLSRGEKEKDVAWFLITSPGFPRRREHLVGGAGGNVGVASGRARGWRGGGLGSALGGETEGVRDGEGREEGGREGGGGVGEGAECHQQVHGAEGGGGGGRASEDVDGEDQEERVEGVGEEMRRVVGRVDRKCVLTTGDTTMTCNIYLDLRHLVLITST